VLDNGLIALVRENDSSPSVVIEGYLPIGSVHEAPHLAGLATFTASMLMRGTRRHTFTEINEMIEAVGASVGVGAGRHNTGFSGQCLAEDLSLLVNMLSEILQEPAFPAEHVERVRGQRLTSLQERENDTRQMAGLAFREMAYPEGHPYRVASSGYPETVRAITGGDLVSYYEQLYGPRGGAISIVGAIDTSQVIDLLASTIGRWAPAVKAGDTTAPAVAPLDSIRRKNVVMPGKTQTDLVIGTPALSRSDPDFQAAVLANTVLGVFGMMGRLGERVREQQGLAYYAYSSLEADKGPGPWAAVAGVDPANVERAIASIEDEISRMATELAPEEELDDSKAYMTGSLPLSLETNDGVASVLLDMEWYGLGLDYLQRYPGLVRAVTADQVRDIIARYFRPQAYALGVAGPRE
jgi:zinc protease